MSQDTNENCFDKAAKTWDEKPRRIELANAVSKSIKSLLPLQPNMKAMEYGCGTGLVSIALSPFLKHITAVDNSTKMLEVLEEKLQSYNIENITPKSLDLTEPSINLTTHRYDLIFTSMTLHHIPDVATLIKRFYEILLPKGWLAIADLDKEDGDFHEPSIQVPHHGFERKELEALLQKNGFSNIKTTTAHEIKKEVTGGVIKTFPVFLMIGQK